MGPAQPCDALGVSVDEDPERLPDAEHRRDPQEGVGSLETGRVARRLARRQRQIYTSKRRDPGADRAGEICAGRGLCDRLPQDLPTLFLHRAAMLGGAHAEPALEVVLEIADCDAGSFGRPVSGAKTIGGDCKAIQRGDRLRSFAVWSPLLRLRRSDDPGHLKRAPGLFSDRRCRSDVSRGRRSVRPPVLSPQATALMLRFLETWA